MKDEKEQHLSEKTTVNEHILKQMTIDIKERFLQEIFTMSIASEEKNSAS